MMNIKKRIIIFIIYQLLCGRLYANSINNEILECTECLENPDNCFNKTLTHSLTINSRSVEYIDLFNDFKTKKGSIVELSYIFTSIKGDSITVQLENAKDQYIIESRDNRVGCSNRKSLKFYRQNERIAVYCNNLYYDCEVKYDFAFIEPEKERDDIPLPQCSECTSVNESNSCFESIYLPVHSWYYLYYEGYDSGSYLDFLISSHKKDTMRIEVQSKDGLFYLVSTRRDKARCSEPQKSVPVRWKSPRIAVYCYNNYIGCKFSLFVRSFPMDSKFKKLENEKIAEESFNAPLYTKFMNNAEKMKGYAEPATPKWSEWSEWSECVEYRDGMGRRVRERKCLYTAIDFVVPENKTQISSKELDNLLKSSNYPYCEGSSVEFQNCPIEINNQSIENLIIFVFIISAMILTFFIENKPISNDLTNYDEDVIKSNDLNGSNSQLRRVQREISISENSPLLNTYFRRYD